MLDLRTEKYEAIQEYLKSNGFACASKALEKLAGYTEQIFLDETDEMKIKTMNRKFDHTLDVVVNSYVGQENVQNVRDLELDIVIATLHDTGRAMEIKGLPTKDRFTGKVDHTQLGLYYLFEKGYISEFLTEDFKDTKTLDNIKLAISLHGVNAFNRGDLTDEQFQLVQKIRTYDKMAIMDSFLTVDMQTVIGMTLDELAQNVPISDLTLQELTSNSTVDRKAEEYTRMRHFLSHVGFVYDPYNTEELLYHLYEEQWVDKYLDRLPVEKMKSGDSEKLSSIRTSAKGYIKQKLNIREVDIDNIQR